jgi:hypothetical protein
MSLDSSSFAYMSLSFSIHVMIIDGIFMPLVGVDSVITLHLSLSNVYLIPNLTLNLASVGHICDSGDYLVIFSSFFVVCKICNLRS